MNGGPKPSTEARNAQRNTEHVRRDHVPVARLHGYEQNCTTASPSCPLPPPWRAFDGGPELISRRADDARPPPGPQGPRPHLSGHGPERSNSSTPPCTCAARCSSPASPAPASRPSPTRSPTSWASARCCAGRSPAGPRCATASTSTTPLARLYAASAATAGAAPDDRPATAASSGYLAARPARHGAAARTPAPGAADRRDRQERPRPAQRPAERLRGGRVRDPRAGPRRRQQPEAEVHHRRHRPSGSRSRRGRVRCRAFPFIVLTSNGEREFPPAFLRRCVRLDLHQPDDEHLEEHRPRPPRRDPTRTHST